MLTGIERSRLESAGHRRALCRWHRFAHSYIGEKPVRPEPVFCIPIPMSALPPIIHDKYA
jgi:hypothetical protein